MKLAELYATAKEHFPFELVSSPLVRFLPRRATIDQVDYKYESQIKISKAKRIAKEEENDEEIKKSTKKQKKCEWKK
ncbi:hypothetical protein NEMIN01_0416 [Nematocida minor]|uniref:uncharacterized protein n=1 Tax=Nematocida minor TaxID=1912983 RepID=UPI00221EF06F|nr:uncharacterized protein NEMIN01_0416 [Nematocida minor]KAI5189353.1 hypothetical protein NEMIN01_0416 [Nematocida minor]